MYKKGFTLAEVLVTLGIIGVVAALTTPALIQNVGNAKIGPKLQKAKATFETASEMMLTENSVNTILAISNNSADLGKELSRFMKISANDNDITYKGYNTEAAGLGGGSTISDYSRYDSDDGMIYYIDNYGWVLHPMEDFDDIPNNQMIGWVYVDINGSEAPNTVAKDMFGFELFNDGSLRPIAGMNSGRHHTRENMRTQYSWEGSNSVYQCDKDGVKAGGIGCTGSIFDNGMKIIYQ